MRAKKGRRARKSAVSRPRPLPKNPSTPPRLEVEALPQFAPGDGNPVWGSALVKRTAILQYNPALDDDTHPRREGPFTLSARPHVTIGSYQGFPEGVRKTPDLRRNPDSERGRVTVALGECATGGLVGHDLDLSVSFYNPMKGLQEIDGPITIEQALSFEEAVRAVFEAARQTGILPIASKHRVRPAR